MDSLLIAVVLFALIFDFTNGFHDTANAIATSVSTRAVSPKIAVAACAILNFLGAFVSLKVAATVAKGIVVPGAITLQVVLAGIMAAILWNFFTWRFGLPTSSSHALIGGVAGAAISVAGWNAVKWQGLTQKVLIPSLAAPVLGLLVAGIVMIIILWLTRRHENTPRMQTVFRRLQLISGGFVAFTHGTNDAQKTMGVIALALIATHPHAAFHIPLWVIASSAAAMGLGSYIGGWRIINTLGTRIVHLEPSQGFAAEVATATLLATAANSGLPVSTTHTVSGSIMGAGIASGRERIRWTVARDIGIAWVATVPAVGLVAATLEMLGKSPAGILASVTLAVGLSALIIGTRNWTWASTAQIRARLNLLQYISRPQ